MKRACIAALLVLAMELAATAQNRGFTPSSSSSASNTSTATTASGTSSPSISQSATRSFVPARHRSRFFGQGGFPPQCNTSGISPLIPSAMGCTDPRFTGGTVNLWPSFSTGYPLYYAPYAYPVVGGEQPATAPAEEPEPPALTVFERRPIAAPLRPMTAGTEPESRGSSHAVEQNASSKAEQVPTVLVFRDGHRAEVLNYAIVGQTLYDLGTFVAHKIPLSDLNLRATIKANEERGVEFSIPGNVQLD